LVSARPRDSEEKRAVFKGFDVMSQAPIQREKIACEKIKRPAQRSQPYVAAKSVNRDSPLRLMPRNSRVGFDGREDDTEVFVLHKRLGLLTTRPVGFAVELLELSREIEFQKRTGHRRRVRSPMAAAFMKHI
jgi:hypothetical protein